MLNIMVTLVILAVGWYTVNIARSAWGDGNRGGAAAAMLLALTAVALPLLLLFGGLN